MTYRPSCVWGLTSDLQTRLCLGTDDEGPTNSPRRLDSGHETWNNWRGMNKRLKAKYSDCHRYWRHTGKHQATHLMSHVSHPITHHPLTPLHWSPWRHQSAADHTSGGGGEWHCWELKHSILNLIHCLIMLLLLVALAITSWPRLDRPDLGPWPRVDLG